MKRKTERGVERQQILITIWLRLSWALMVTPLGVSALGQEKPETVFLRGKNETTQRAEDTTLSTFDLHQTYNVRPPSQKGDVKPPSRKGFVYGGGVGASIPCWSTVYQGRKFSERGIGPGLNGFIGYGLDDRNIAGVELNFGFYSSEMFDLKLGRYFIGPVWQHYFSPPGKSFFSVIGIGKYDFSAIESHCLYEGDYPWFEPCSKHVSGTPWPPTHAGGLGYLAGGGYEFLKGYRLGGYITIAQTSDDFWEQHFGNIDIVIFLSRFVY